MDPERTLIGALLVAEGTLQETLLTECATIRPTDFADGRCRDAFAAIRDLDAGEWDVNLVSVKDWLAGRKLAPDVAWLATLVDGVPRVESVRWWVEAIVRRATARAAAVRGQALIERLQEAALDDMAEEAQPLVDKLADLGRSAAQRLAPDDGAAEAADVIAQVIANLDEYRARGGIEGLSTGLFDLDRLIGGLRSSRLYVFGARTADGKSTLAGQIASEVALAGGTVVLFSLEMTADAMIERVVIREANTPKRSIYGPASDGAWEKVSETALSLASERPPLYVVDRSGLTVAQMRGYIEGVRRRRKGNVDLVVVDHVQIVAHPDKLRQPDSRYLALRMIAEELREIARDLKIPVCLMSQLNPAPREAKDDREPRMAELRESSDIQNTADCVVLVHHERDDPSDRRRITRSKLIVAKNRFGTVGEALVSFDGARNTFENVARPDVESFQRSPVKE